MICQVESIKTKTQALPALHRAQVQGGVYSRQTQALGRLSWQPAFTPYVAPLTRWVE